MLAWFNALLAFIATASIARALAFGLISGMMLTQWVKFQLPDWLSDRDHARWVRTLSSLLTMATVLALWPYARYFDAIALAFGAGLTTPFAYWLGVKALYHFFPWTETILSARPGSKRQDKAT